MSFELTRSLVKAILKSPFDLKWSVQGLGMLRTYLDDKQKYRLHVWDNSLRVPNVSPIHDHPWHLDSLIVAGKLKQKRYRIGGITSVACYEGGYALSSEVFQMSAIKCGENACTKTDPIKVKAYCRGLETYIPGERYQQTKDEVHETMAEDGTVTIVDRVFEGDRDTAHVFWRGDGGWVDAAPRPATEDEVLRVLHNALKGF